MSRLTTSQELEQYRNVMEVPSTFEDGFSWTALFGALFVAMLMVPGAMYMKLLAGYGVGPAAQWVTVILFLEVARRAHRTLKKAELFVLFYMAAAAMSQPFSGPLFRQFFVQSNAATGMGVAEHLPIWFAPTDPDILAQRDFFNPVWYPALGLIIFQMLMSRINTSILSYGFFRLASDIEKLPFPMAPIGAQGITALAEQQEEESQAGAEEGTGNWRWRVFSIGGVLGLSFGAVYLALPAISNAVLDESISILPIPFLDLTPKTAGFLEAAATGISLNMGQLVFGMVLPFFAVVGSFIGYMIQIVANPFLYNAGILNSWRPTDDTITTMFRNFMDFYFSFGLGVTIALALMGFWQIFRAFRKTTKRGDSDEDTEGSIWDVPEGRGDIKLRWVLITYMATTMVYILLSGWLIDWHPGVMWVLFFFGFIYTPVIAYVTVRLEGTAGQIVQIPYVREAAYILSGYQGGVKVWFLPIPLSDYGQRTLFWRQSELTGTKFWSIWKAEIALIPIVLIASIFFAQFIWSLAPIPGPEYPFADMMWELNAAQRCVMYTATLGGFSQFEEALNGWYLAAGTGVGLLMFGTMSLFSLPTMLAYGVVKGLNQVALPHVIPTQFIGALIGRFYFERKMGLKWRQYIPVVAAGFACGMGLITVFGIGINFLAKSVIRIPF